MQRLRIIATGFIGLYPTGGVTWDYLQYLMGLRLLGHDVYYIEDTGQYSNYRPTHTISDEPLDSVTYLEKVMSKFGFDNRWAYRDMITGNCYGLSEKECIRVCKKADIFLNISAASIRRPEYMSIPVRILLDSDPMFTQLQWMEKKDHSDLSYQSYNFAFEDYTHHYSFGENIGTAGCRVPTLGIKWIATRQPIVLLEWGGEVEMNDPRFGFSTIMNWSTRSKLNYDNEEWGQKDVEFSRIMKLPMHVRNEDFDVVMSVSSGLSDTVCREQIIQHGWNVISPDIIDSAESYRAFIQSSKAEFSVAKETYVKSKSGWFSCRSACYLAAGKPVITQQTGWSKNIPAGEGLFAFTDESSAMAAIEEINKGYSFHCKAAREIAREYFDSNKILAAFLQKI